MLLNTKAVFVDIDGTITDDQSDNTYLNDPDINGCYFSGVLRNLLVDRLKISPREALDRIVEMTTTCGWRNPFYATRTFDVGISEEEVWREVLKWQEKHVILFDDAVFMITELYNRGFDLYIVTNGAREVALAKLARGRLATAKGSKYFKRIYSCFDVFNCQKDNPLVYERIISREQLDPAKVVMVGDSPEQDLAVPNKVGISNVFIVDRKQEKQTVSANNGGLYVKDLRIVPTLLCRNGA